MLIEVGIEKFRSKYGLSHFIKLSFDDEVMSLLNLNIGDLLYVYYTNNFTVINAKKSLNEEGSRICFNRETFLYSVKVPINTRNLVGSDLTSLEKTVNSNQIKITLLAPIWSGKSTFSARTPTNSRGQPRYGLEKFESRHLN